jgi:hypothetical protein
MDEPHGDNPLVIPGLIVLVLAVLFAGFWFEYQWKKAIVKDAVEEVLRGRAK